MLHVTEHFDAGDIDLLDGSPIRAKARVYHAKRRFPSPDVNMHYGTTHQIVGGTTGDKDLDDQRFRTTQKSEFCNDKIAFK